MNYFCKKTKTLTNIGKISLPPYPLILAPMEDITDSSFRMLCKSYGADLLYTEFIASDALVRYVPRSLKKLEFEPMERPIGVQIFGRCPDTMAEAAAIAESYQPDFIDLNFGCPVKKVVNKGGGAALLNNPSKMIEITNAVVKKVKIPVTVKTRLGWDDKNKPIVEVAEHLQDAGASAIAIHGRTKAQMYGGKADWSLIGEVVRNPAMHIPVFGNGDVICPKTAMNVRQEYGVHGVMIGRACIGNPWLFDQIKHFFKTRQLKPPPDIKKRIEVCKWFLLKSVELKGEKRGIFHLRRHYSAFFKGLPNIKNLRMQLVTSNSVEEIMDILDNIPERESHV